MTTLTSRNNPRIKQIRRLLSQRKERKTSGLFVVEGIHHIGEAIDAQAKIAAICYAPDLLTSKYAIQLVHEQSGRGVACLAVDSGTFADLAEKDNPQGIIAIVHQPKVQIDALSPGDFPRGVALVAPQDPGNIGTILRTIDAVGASGLLLLDDPLNNQYSTDPYHPSSVRASMGSIFWHPLVSTTFADFLQWVKNHRYKVYGTSTHAKLDFRQVEHFELPLILLMGSEREGLTTDQSGACDVMLRIPMQGRASSLNLAVATGVILYHMFDQMN